MLEQATGDSVVVMNESFASTTLRDALFVGERVLDRMTARGLLGVYVTFVDELASLNEACVSMVGTVVPDNPAERTYEIVRKPADGLAYAAAIAIVHRTRQLLQIYVDMLRLLRGIADAHAASFGSEGFTRFFAMIARELGDEYLAEIEVQIGELAFRRGTLISARLGTGSNGTGYIVRRQPGSPTARRDAWWRLRSCARSRTERAGKRIRRRGGPACSVNARGRMGRGYRTSAERGPGSRACSLAAAAVADQRDRDQRNGSHQPQQHRHCLPQA